MEAFSRVSGPSARGRRLCNVLRPFSLLLFLYFFLLFFLIC